MSLYFSRIVNESKSLVNGLETGEAERSATPDLFGSGIPTAPVPGEHFDSPYIPSAPMNSPSNTPAAVGPSNSWFPGVSHVTSAATSYPNWQQDHGSPSQCGTAGEVVWSPFEADDSENDGPSPSKRLFLQDDEAAKKTSGDLVPMVAVAPLLGQLLNSAEDASEHPSNGQVADPIADDGTSLDSSNEGSTVDHGESEKSGMIF
jgi:hypothetical protein